MIYKIKRFSWNSWIDKRIENSDNRVDKMRQWNKAYRESPETPDEKRISDIIRSRIKSEGTKIIDSESRGGGFTPDLKYIPRDKIEKFGLKPEELGEKQKYIFVHPQSKPYVISHEHGHSKGGKIYDWIWRRAEKKGLDDTLSTTIDETRANINAWNEIKKLNPKKETWENSKQGILNSEKQYLEKTYQNFLKRLKIK